MRLTNRFSPNAKRRRKRLNRFTFTFALAVVAVAAVYVESVEAADMHLTVQYVFSIDSSGPIPNSPPAPLFPQSAPHNMNPPFAVHVPGAIHAFAVSMSITRTALAADFNSVLFDLELGPGVTPAEFGYVGNSPLNDPPGQLPNGPVYSENYDAFYANDLKGISVTADDNGGYARTHAVQPGEAGGTLGFPTWLGNAYVLWDGTTGLDGKTWVGVSKPQFFSTPWSLVSGFNVTFQPASTMSVGPRSEWVFPLDGDFNQDGTIDAADYVVWRKNPGGIYTPGEFNVCAPTLGKRAATARQEPRPPKLQCPSRQPWSC